MIEIQIIERFYCTFFWKLFIIILKLCSILQRYLFSQIKKWLFNLYLVSLKS